MKRGNIHLFWHSDSVAQLILDNPEARNAMSIPMMNQLQEHAKEICSSKARVVILTAKGENAFCAGGDLNDVRDHLIDTAKAKEMNHNIRAALTSFSTNQIFVIVALNGPAVGGGAELTTYGDVVIAEPNAYISFVHTRLGVSPGWGGGLKLMEKVGKHRARQLLVLSEKTSLERCLSIGLIDEISEKGGALTRSIALAQKISRNPAHAVQGVMQLCDNGDVSIETEIFLSLWGKEPHRRALGMKS